MNSDLKMNLKIVGLSCKKVGFIICKYREDPKLEMKMEICVRDALMVSTNAVLFLANT